MNKKIEDIIKMLKEAGAEVISVKDKEGLSEEDKEDLKITNKVYDVIHKAFLSTRDLPNANSNRMHIAMVATNKLAARVTAGALATKLKADDELEDEEEIEEEIDKAVAWAIAQYHVMLKRYLRSMIEKLDTEDEE